MTYNEKKTLYESIMKEISKVVKKELNEQIEYKRPYSIPESTDKIKNIDAIRVKATNGAVYEYKIIEVDNTKFFEIHINEKEYPYDMQWWAACEDNHLVWRVWPHKRNEEMRGNGYGFEPNFHAVLVWSYKEKIAQLINKYMGQQCAQDFIDKVKKVVN